MLRKLAKRLLLTKAVSSKLAPVYCGKREKDRQEFESEFVRSFICNRNYWIFSQPKSGTTLLCNALAAYSALASGQEFSLSDISRFGVFRVTDPTQSLNRLIEIKQRNPSLPIFLHTHWKVKSRYRHAFILTRNPADQIVSNYFFKFANRKNRSGVSLDHALENLISGFVRVYNEQHEVIKGNSGNISVITYEDLISDTPGVLSSILRKLEVQVDFDIVRMALELVSPEKVRSFERSSGRAIVAAENYIGKSFIRSGQIGESRHVLSDAQQRLLETGLRKGGLVQMAFRLSDDRFSSHQPPKLFSRVDFWTPETTRASIISAANPAFRAMVARMEAA